ncbi:MAG: ADP-ribosylglycohydrolase family protein [Clostridia bacterium]|nr:ADP-ribosylglycohydrolase family protein [Clostridia bacterium]
MEDGPPPATDPDDYYGAWLGRCVGCALGQPVELWRGEDIRNWYQNAGKYPIDGYVPTVSGEYRNERPSTDEKIRGMPEDDDIRFTVLAVKLLEKKGTDFDSYDVGAHWMYSIPFRSVCTAENQVYLNFASVDSFGPWGRPENALETLRKAKINEYRNPYREWIGAQIRVDGYAYCAAGRPALAARMAYEDAFLSHVKNGVYSSMFFSALIASAFAVKDIGACFDTALSFVPKRSRFYETAIRARRIGETAVSREDLADRVLGEMRPYGFVHALNNSAVCIASIFRSGGDFAEAVCTALNCGMDTDCNCATVGSFMGALCGAKGIPARFADPMADTFSSGLSGYDGVSIRGFADKCARLRERFL